MKILLVILLLLKAKGIHNSHCLVGDELSLDDRTILATAMSVTQDMGTAAHLSGAHSLVCALFTSRLPQILEISCATFLCDVPGRIQYMTINTH